MYFPSLFVSEWCTSANNNFIFYLPRVAKLHHGHLSHADGNGDWVLTIFTALSLVSDVYTWVLSLPPPLFAEFIFGFMKILLRICSAVPLIIC